MCFRYFFLNPSVSAMLELMTGEEAIYHQPSIINYRDDLYNIYKSYKLRKIYSYFLRFLQASAGVGITTMTTANNPYFKDNVDLINIILWYVSISNNIVNLLLEKTQSYNLPDEKLKIKLLISEGRKYLDNYKDYSLYEEDEPNKLRYFDKCYHEILDRTPYEYLIYQGRRPSHASIDVKQRRLEILREAWSENDEVDNIIICTDL